MAIQSIGTATSFASTASANGAAKSTSESYDNEIKSLENQKMTIQKQINEIRTDSQAQVLKDEQLKPLQQELAQIEAHIQQKKLEKARNRPKSADSKKSGTANASDVPNSTRSNTDNVRTSGEQETENKLKTVDIYNKFGHLI